MDLQVQNIHLIFIGILILGIFLFLLRKYMHGPRCSSTARLDHKIVVITGANTGIGKETAVNLAQRGATIIAACRDENKGLKAVAEIRERSKNSQVFFKQLDLACLQSIRKFADEFVSEYSKLHILINNAGLMVHPYLKTKDDFEMQIGTNHLGHFALTNLLLKQLKNAAPSRIVNVSSGAHALVRGINFDDLQSEESYSAWTAYGQSKLANILFTKELDRRLKPHGITSYALHPGVVDTKLQRQVALIYFLARLTFGFLTKPPEMGAQTSIYCAVQEGLESNSGQYFSDCQMKRSSKASYDEGAAKKLWDLSEQLTNIKFPF